MVDSTYCKLIIKKIDTMSNDSEHKNKGKAQSISEKYKFLALQK